MGKLKFSHRVMSPEQADRCLREMFPDFRIGVVETDADGNFVADVYTGFSTYTVAIPKGQRFGIAKEVSYASSIR